MMKKGVFTKAAALMLALVMTLSCIIAINAEDEAAPATDITAHNLALENEINILYYVRETNLPEGAESGVLIWKAYQEEYSYGTEDYKITKVDSVDENGRKVFAFDKVAAKQACDDFYAVSYIKNGTEIVYGTPDKYSILTYCINKKDSEETLSVGDCTLGELVESIREYCATAQRFFGYKLDDLATDDHVKITVSGGVLPDGTTSGLYRSGTVLNLTDTVDHDYVAAWYDSSDRAVGIGERISVTAGTVNEVYTVLEPVPSEGFRFETINGGTESAVSGIGSCTDNLIVIPNADNNGGGKQTVAIYERAFSSCKSIEFVIIPFTVPLSAGIGYGAFGYCTNLKSVIVDCAGTIGIYAFQSCTGLKSIRLPENLESIGAGAFRGCTGLTSIVIPENLFSIGAGAFNGCTGLTSIIIPESVTEMGQNVFQNCSNLTIYCRAESAPEGWANNWNGGCSVVWGYTGD